MPFETANAGAEDADLIELVASRLCHDLISPIGAIGNGVELLTMTSEAPGPEVELISQSVAAANARVKFFRLAFGRAGPDQQLSEAEITGLLGEVSAQSRVEYDWRAPGETPRAEVKLALLAMLCLETALPFGGDIRAMPCGDGWMITARAEKARPDRAAFAALDGEPLDLTPTRVQFALLPREAARQGRRLDWSVDSEGGTIAF
ncbi:histidine phosphotransferase [Thioclava sp. NG1]|uniref:histidine phosphotransferase family protein n=1 Tax=unclassified Thioclava TaxID=2621713 RepID=UPI000B53AD72|nr:MULTISPECIES: histidine phosphotransferase family protein [unclassified Thioclava]OWY05203.1 hypothetical protein B6V75_03485 [Thioclava sp. F1Mire-8]PWE48626.1 histidine phosphotransferase [Thioclava sp. NG1]